MPRVAIAFTTKDRTDYTAQTLPRILDEAEGNFDFYWLDGSTTPDGLSYPNRFIYKWRNEHDGKNPVTRVYENVRGGAAMAIVTTWQILYQMGDKYDYIGIIENDVLLEPGWFKRCMGLFEIKKHIQNWVYDTDKREGLINIKAVEVGAVSARCFKHRILRKEENFAVMANVGAGMFITRRDLIPALLENFRRPMLWEMQVFCKYFTGYDYPTPKGVVEQDPEIKQSWQMSEDWMFEAVLWSKGYSTLACVPSMSINLDDPEGVRDPAQL